MLSFILTAGTGGILPNITLYGPVKKRSTDEGSKEKEADTAEETYGPNVENVKQKRKRKDKRAPKDRRKKQKKESKEVQD